MSKVTVNELVSPPFLYGTAWKEEATRSLTRLALEQGFRGIDTANQRKHYDEASVGQGIADAIQAGVVTREELFLQTKFTFRAGQDHRLPYDPQAPIERQVEQSFARSLEHLGVDRLNSYVLHGPSRRVGLGAEDWSAWRAMEALVDSGRVRMLGVSNVSYEQLERLCQDARIPPSMVQNRCYASRGWDRAVRQFCKARGMIYQGFSLLTANREVLAHPTLRQIAKRQGATTSQVIFRFALDVGMLPLTGTTQAAHMREDLEVDRLQLEGNAIEIIEQISGAG
jgi:diketogulonate reductase-like aldo/keto reductase